MFNSTDVELSTHKGSGVVVGLGDVPPTIFIISSLKKADVHHAAMSGSVSVLKELRAQGVDLAEADGAGRLPLHDACLSGQSNVVRFFLEEVHDCQKMINTKDEMGMTTIHLAAAMGFVPIVELLLTKESEKIIDETDRSGKSAFQYAMQNKNYACAYILLVSGAQATLKDINALFAWALELKLLEKAEKLFEKYNADLRTKNKSGLTWLDVAVAAGEVDVVKKILASHKVDAQHRAKALVFASQCYEKAKQCRQVEFWTPVYTDEDKQNLNLISKCLTETFVEKELQKIEAPKITK